MARRIARTGFRRTKRPGGTWSRLIIEPVAVPAASKVLASVGLLSNPGIGETIRRTLGGVYVTSDQNAAVENQHGAAGMIVVSDLAIAAGAASIPGPATDSDDDGWFVWQGFSQRLLFGTNTGFRDAGRWYPYDSRGMRRTEEGFGFAIMFENADPTHGIQVGMVISLYATRN